jgi:uncharacterized FlaG/YvyC family protein
MSDIGSLGSQLANASNAGQAKANVRPESPPPLTIQNAVAQTLNTPQTAVMQSPTGGNAEWRREANPDGRGGNAQAQEENAPPRKQLDAFLECLNQLMRRHDTHLQFEVVGSNTDWRIRIVDQNTHELVRWISWEETRAFALALEELEIQSSTGTLGMGGGLLRVTA